jgi:hypothetical protein
MMLLHGQSAVTQAGRAGMSFMTARVKYPGRGLSLAGLRG